MADMNMPPTSNTNINRLLAAMVTLALAFVGWGLNRWGDSVDQRSAEILDNQELIFRIVTDKLDLQQDDIDRLKTEVRIHDVWARTEQSNMNARQTEAEARLRYLEQERNDRHNGE